MFFRVNDDQHDNIDKAVETLKMGGVVLHDTTSPWQWVLSCDATNEVAVQKIIALKKEIQPLDGMVIVQDEQMLEEYICPLPYFVRQFMHKQEKHMTVVHPFANRIAESACLRWGALPVRIIPSVDAPPIQMSRHVLRLLGKPIFVTTCTVDGRRMPTAYEEIEDHIKTGADLISPLLFGIDDVGVFSMVIKYDLAGHIEVVRK